MARMPNNPSLMVMYGSFLLEVRKDGQAALTQMQLAQKANPLLLDNYKIFVARLSATKAKTGGSSLQQHDAACLQGEWAT